MPLYQVIADLSHYHHGYLKAHAEVAKLRFTGVLPTDDPEAALNLLKDALPISVERRNPWVTRLVSADL